MYSNNEYRRKHTLIAVCLLAMLLASAGFVFYLYGEWVATSMGYTQLYWQSQIANMTLQQINATAPKVTITLTFTPTPPEKTVPPNTVTFLTGYLTATNLTDLYYPCTLIANFTVTHTTTNPNIQVEYSYIPYQTVYLLKGIQTVQIPAGIFPLAIYNATKGDQITLTMTTVVQIFWEPIHALICQQQVKAQFTINIGG